MPLQRAASTRSISSHTHSNSTLLNHSGTLFVCAYFSYQITSVLFIHSSDEFKTSLSCLMFVVVCVCLHSQNWVDAAIVAKWCDSKMFCVVLCGTHFSHIKYGFWFIVLQVMSSHVLCHLCSLTLSICVHSHSFTSHSLISSLFLLPPPLVFSLLI
jgi:hypothetical protein